MCGRYALYLRPSQIRQMLQDDDMAVDDAPEDDGSSAPRQSYNFAPGYHGVVYRADTPEYGAGERHRNRKEASTVANQAETGGTSDEGRKITNSHDDTTAENKSGKAPERFILQSMKWGLIPFWTKRNPGYGAMLKTINCRDDSLAQQGGMWSSMKARKRCVVVAQGFYEWLKPRGGGSNAQHKIPHYVKRADGRLMCFAGLWDCVRFEENRDGDEGPGARSGAGYPGGEPLYTYTIVTTGSNAQLRFLHDRMPVILDPGSEGLRTWLDPRRHEWSKDLQGLLKPYDGELEVYPVSQEVGKVGNNSPTFIIPVASKENKRNIANFFPNAKGSPKKGIAQEQEISTESIAEPRTKADGGTGTGAGAGAKEPEAKEEGTKDINEQAKEGQKRVEQANVGVKREASGSPSAEEKPVAKKGSITPAKPPWSRLEGKRRHGISATSNVGKSLGKIKAKDKGDGGGGGGGGGSQKITSFFASQ